MAKPTFYRVIDRPDGLFDIEVMVAGNPTHRRCGFLSVAEVDAALDDLRALMTACGAPLLRAEFGEEASTDDRADRRHALACRRGASLETGGRA